MIDAPFIRNLAATERAAIQPAGDAPHGYIAIAMVGSTQTKVAFSNVAAARRECIAGNITPYWITPAATSVTSAAQVVGYITEKALEEIRADVNGNPLSLWPRGSEQYKATIPVYLAAPSEQPAVAAVPEQMWRRVMQRFVDRVERGEVRSKQTYAEFKELLAIPPAPVPASHPDLCQACNRVHKSPDCAPEDRAAVREAVSGEFPPLPITWQMRKGYGPKTTVGIKDVDDEIAELRAYVLTDRGIRGKASDAEDAARIDHIEAWRLKGKERGFAWNSYDFTTDKPIREQLDAARAQQQEADAP